MKAHILYKLFIVAIVLVISACGGSSTEDGVSSTDDQVSSTEDEVDQEVTPPVDIIPVEEPTNKTILEGTWVSNCLSNSNATFTFIQTTLIFSGGEYEATTNVFDNPSCFGEVLTTKSYAALFIIGETITTISGLEAVEVDILFNGDYRENIVSINGDTLYLGVDSEQDDRPVELNYDYVYTKISDSSTPNQPAAEEELDQLKMGDWFYGGSYDGFFEEQHIVISENKIRFYSIVSGNLMESAYSGLHDLPLDSSPLGLDPNKHYKYSIDANDVNIYVIDDESIAVSTEVQTGKNIGTATILNVSDGSEVISWQQQVPTIPTNYIFQLELEGDTLSFGIPSHPLIYTRANN